MTDTIKFLYLGDVINRLAEGLTDPQAITRLTRGVMYTQIVDSKSFDRVTFNKLSIPIFCRTVYDNHCFDVPIIDYMNALVAFVDDVKWDTYDTTVDQAAGIDREADVMEELAIQFMADFDKANNS